MPAHLEIVTYPGTEKWALRPKDAELISRWMNEPIRLEYWPRKKVPEVWTRDKGSAAPDQAQEVELAGLNFRGYSFATEERGPVAVIFVDQLETYESATFVVLHELAHLHLPPWSPAVQRSDEQVEEEEVRADQVAAKLMAALLGYKEGVREVYGEGGRAANPRVTCCPRFHFVQ